MRSLSRRSILVAAVVALVGIFISPASGLARPKAFKPAFAISHAGSSFLTLSLTGSGFGAPDSASQVRVVGIAGGTTVVLLVPSGDPSVIEWSDEHVVVNVRPDLTRAHIGVQTSTGSSSLIPADHYDFQTFDTSAALGVNTAPSHITLDAQDRVWINSEFHFGIAYFDPASRTLKPAFWPRVPVPAFEVCLNTTCAPTQQSQGGEDALTDPDGRVWLPEGGPPDVGPRNHARIIGYDPAAHKVIVFNLPGDRNSPTGVAWDPIRRRLWFSQTGVSGVRPGSLTSFDPDNPAIPREEYPWDFATLPACTGGICSDNPARSCSNFRDCMVGTFDFTTSATCTAGLCSNAPYHQCQAVDDCVYADKICPPNVTDDSACYHDYPLSAADYQPAHLAVNPRDGSVWWANYYLGSNLARLDPDTGGRTVFPLAPPPFSPTQITFNSLVELVTDLPRIIDWPWDVKVAPNGDIVATEFYSNKIARIRPSRFTDPRCQQLAPPRGSSVNCAIATIGTTFPETITLPDPSCVNPCIVESLEPDSWVPDASTLPFTHSPVTALAVTSSDRKKNVWFGQGVFVKGKKNFALLPPLLVLYPSSFGGPATIHTGLGAGTVVNPTTGDVWATDFTGLRLNLLVRVP
jgi:streptogramin lyase